MSSDSLRISTTTVSAFKLGLGLTLGYLAATSLLSLIFMVLQLVVFKRYLP